MSNKIALKPHLGRTDPAKYLRPLIFCAEVIYRRLAVIGWFSTLLTALVVIGCYLAPPIYKATAVIAVDWQAAPETMRVRQLLGAEEGEFMVTQETLLQAETMLRPIEERYNLLEREGQLRRFFFWHYSATKERAIRNGPIELKHLKIQHDPKTYLLTVTYSDRDPQVAADVANAIADSYLRKISEARMKETGGLNSSIELQLNELKEHLEAIDLALLAPQPAPKTTEPEERVSLPLSNPQPPRTGGAEGNRVPRGVAYRQANYGLLPPYGASDRWRDIIENVRLPLGKADKAAADEPKRDVTVAAVGSSDAVHESGKQLDLDLRPSDYLKLKHELDAAQRVFGNLFAQINQVGVRSDLHNFIRLADSARPPATPIFPDWPLIIGLSMAFCALSCAIYVVWAEVTDVTAREAAPTEKILGIPVVCTLPTLTDAKRHLGLGPTGMRLTGNESSIDSFFDQGVRYLRAYLTLSQQTSAAKSVLITSALPGEGKSTLALSLAMANAEQGRRTLLIDANLREPAIQRLARLNPSDGLSAVLAHTTDWRTATCAVPGHANLFVLGSGSPSPARTLMGPRMHEILDQATEEFDLVILDSPSLPACADTLELAAAAELTLLAVRRGHTGVKALEAARDQLRRVNAKIAGIVFNQSATKTDPLYQAYARRYSSFGRYQRACL